MQAPIETRQYPPFESTFSLARVARDRWITALYSALASISALLAHALVPALLIAWAQNARPPTPPNNATAWTLFVGSFLVAVLLIAVCAYFAARAAAERTGRRGSGLGAAAIVATCGMFALALGGLTAILAQASPLTAVNGPSLGVAPRPYHEGLAQGVALFYCAAYLPLLLLASLGGLLGATRSAGLALRAQASVPTIALTPASRRVA
jgi:predicted permease